MDTNALDESRIVSIHIPIKPIAKGRPRFTRSGHAYTPQRTRDAEASIREFLRQEFDSSGEIPFRGAVAVTVDIVLARPKSAKRAFPTVRPDTDNLLKTVLDSANEIVWDDDCQIIRLTAQKRYVDPELGESEPFWEMTVVSIPCNEATLRTVSLGRPVKRDRSLPTSSPEVSIPEQASSGTQGTRKRKTRKSP